MKTEIIQNRNEIGCAYHLKDTTRTYSDEEIYPYGICPWLYYATYPYMLGLLYGANFGFNEEGDAWVTCPAKDGCKTLVRRRNHPGVFDDPRIASDNYFVIYVEVISVGSCPAGHEVGHRFVFPTCMKEHYVCPAAWFHAFPFLNIPKPECIDINAIRCPDWKSDVTIKAGEIKDGKTSIRKT